MKLVIGKHRAKVNYDKKIRCSKLSVGDIVRTTGFQSKHKIAD